MDTALANNLDQYIFKLQEVSRLLKGSRSASFLKAKRDNAAIARKSARVYLAYCALVSVLRRNIGLISEPSCVALITVPSNWRLVDVNEAAKIIFKDDKVRCCMHPAAKSRRGWEIDPTEHLKSEKLIVFVQEGSVVHEDFELAATLRDRLNVCDRRHLRAVGRLRGCGEVSDDQAALIAQQPSERMEAIYRIGQPAQRAALRLSKESYQRPVRDEVKHLDISKGFGEAGVWARELKKDIQEWRDGRLQ
ncbi:hypothetical protein EV128_108216 [Rhizobium azibense]|nr:hypothetical protein EV128_108216 [Rhizobium azibense]